MKEGVKEVLFSEEDISIRTKELAKIIDEDYKGKELLLVGVLKGSVVFISELLKRLHNGLSYCDIWYDFGKSG